MTVNVRLTNKHRMKTFLLNHSLSNELHLLLDQFNYPDFHATLLFKAPKNTHRPQHPPPQSKPIIFSHPSTNFTYNRLLWKRLSCPLIAIALGFY